MRAPHRLRRRGVTLLNAIVLCGLFFVVMAVVLPATYQHRRDGTGSWNACRSNLSNIATGMLLYDGRNGHLPGYMNALERTDGSLYVDPATGRPTAVSWCVELLSDLDRGPLYELWREVPKVDPAASTPQRANLRVYLEILTCPTSWHEDRTQPQLSYVDNTGMPDSADTPRDWPANGVFFDEYSDSPLVRRNAASVPTHAPMRLSSIRDPKDRTILVAENGDAGPYVLPYDKFVDLTAAQQEIAWGCTWTPGPITRVDGKAVMSPGAGAQAPNVGHGGPQRPHDYRYARPSSHHPGGFNVAFAGNNVQFVSEKISYYIYAKLMASDDADAKLPGSDTPLDDAFRSYSVTDGDLNP